MFFWYQSFNSKGLLKKHTIEISGIQKKFDTKLILSDVYLKIETGEIIGLLGRNGSGKSTLLKIICGIISCADKSIFINGISINKYWNILREISYLHQNQFIPNHLSVSKTIFLSVAKQKLMSFCEDIFIKNLLDKKIRELSAGELRYLEVKITLFNSSRFVLLDEPFNGLSPKMIEVVKRLIKENSEEKAILITDHNYNEVISVSNRLLLLFDGKLQNINGKDELVERGYLPSSTLF